MEDLVGLELCSVAEPSCMEDLVGLMGCCPVSMVYVLRRHKIKNRHPYGGR
jgi:hypothetical protein